MACCLLCSNLQAQNLVSNGSFEYVDACPGSFCQSPADLKVSGWKQVGLGTPDYFHACSEGDADVPYNWAGVSEAFEGSGYGGLFLWMDDDKDYREYFYAALESPLLKDSTYIISFHYKLSSYSKFSIDRIGVLLIDQLPKVRHDKLLKVEPTLNVINDSAFTENTGTWEWVNFEYKAKGAERNIIIGNFSSNEETKSYEIISRSIGEPMLAAASYYYIDGVEVRPKFTSEVADTVFSKPVPEAFAVNKNYILSNIQFEFNSHKLIKESLNALDPVISFMISNPDVNIEVSGHTDDQGSDKYNITLSQRRANAVAEYLRIKGVDSKRIKTYAYGKQRPLVPGTSEEGRKQNRRVEVKFVQVMRP